MHLAAGLLNMPVEDLIAWHRPVHTSKHNLQAEPSTTLDDMYLSGALLIIDNAQK